MTNHRIRLGAGWARPNGRCRQCGVEITVPGRRTFCSDTCVDRWKLTSNPGYVRQQVGLRDHGVCGLCGINTQGRWEADHIVPVVEGGGGCGLDGYRTLCIPCHRLVTRDLMGRLAARRKLHMSLTPMLPGLEVT